MHLKCKIFFMQIVQQWINCLLALPEVNTWTKIFTGIKLRKLKLFLAFKNCYRKNFI